MVYSDFDLELNKVVLGFCKGTVVHIQDAFNTDTNEVTLLILMLFSSL